MFAIIVYPDKYLQIRFYMKTANIFALYRGLAPRLARVMIEIGLLFSLYETFYDTFEAMV